MTFQPVVPRLEFLLRVRIQLAPVQEIGATLTGRRRIIPILGGEFSGPRLRGEVLPGGADWQIVTTDGAAILEARYTLRTQDNALIYVCNKGFRHGPPEVLAAIARGDEVDPATYYFRAVPAFETGDPRYSWLNRIVCVSSGMRLPDSVVLDFHEVL